MAAATMTKSTPHAPNITTTSQTTSPNPTTTTTHASYVPHDLKYSSEFEDSLLQTVLHPTTTSSRPPGLRVIPDDSDEQPIEGQSIRLSSIDPSTLPHIHEDELPLPLSDPRRIFASPIAGINLTHPGGYLEGGPGLDPEMDTFPDDFLASRPGVKNGAQLRKALDKELEVAREALKERLRAREKAKAANEAVEKELRTLKDQHEMELKIHNRMQEEVAKKKEAREKRRRESGAGGGVG